MADASTTCRWWTGQVHLPTGSTKERNLSAPPSSTQHYDAAQRKGCSSLRSPFCMHLHSSAPQRIFISPPLMLVPVVSLSLMRFPVVSIVLCLCS